MVHASGPPSETILLVEDEQIVRDLMITVLRRGGYRVLPSADAAGARQIFERSREEIDLLITDVSLPDGDGWRLADELRRAHPALKVIWTSGNFGPGAWSGAPKFTRLLEKPFTATTLSVAVRELLDA